MNKAIILILALFLSSCGFHLRGVIDAAPIWLNNVAIISSQDKQLNMTLKSMLENYKIQVIEEPSQAKFWLMIQEAALSRQIISVGASTNLRQYQLILSIKFLVQNNKGIIIKKLNQVIVSRQLTINNDRILGSTEEESVMINEMQQEACIQIINRLARQ